MSCPILLIRCVVHTHPCSYLTVLVRFVHASMYVFISTIVACTGVELVNIRCSLALLVSLGHAV